jgi:hypothetical protein
MNFIDSVLHDGSYDVGRDEVGEVLHEDVDGFEVEVIEFFVGIAGGDVHICFVESLEGYFLEGFCVSIEVRSFFSAMYLTYSIRNLR